MRSLPAREGLHCSPSFHPIPRACYRRVRDHDTIVVSHGRWSPRDGENPCHPVQLLLRALRSEAAAHEKSSLKRELFAFCGRKNTLRKAHIVRREGWKSTGQRKKKPCLSALSPCRCLETSLALRLTHFRLGSAFSPRMIAAGTFQRDRKKSLREKGGGRGRKAPLFQKGLLPPRHNRPGDDSRTGKISRPVPDR